MSFAVGSVHPTITRVLEWRALGTARRAPNPEAGSTPDKRYVQQPVTARDPNCRRRDQAEVPDPRAGDRRIIALVSGGGSGSDLEPERQPQLR